MEIVRLILLFLHIVGAAAVLGGFLHQLSARVHTVTRIMVGGADLLVLTGLVLVGARAMLQLPFDHAKIAAKLIVAIAVAACAHIARRRDGGPVLFRAIGLLTTLNVALAVFW